MTMQHPVPSVVELIRSEGRPVVLFGAGDIGVIAHYALTTMGVEVTCFADGRQSKQGRTRAGLEIWSPEQLGELPRNTQVFLCGNYLTTMTAQVRSIGFTNIQDCVELFDGFDFTGADIGLPASLIERKVAFHEYQVVKERERADDALVLKYVDIVVTEACSMKCVDCSNLMQYYAKPRHSDLDLLERSVDRIMESVDGLYEFRVLGGEPFVNPRVHRVINKLTAYEGVEKVVIYTNGTIVPRGENLECLLNEKVIVEITDYGTHSRKLDELMAVLAENDISHLSKIPVWTDSGRIKFVERSAEELDDMFHNCCVNDILTLLNGKLYRCPFSANGTNLGAIPEAPADVVDLTGELQGLELRDELRRLYNRSGHLKACGFCNGRDYRTPLIEAAVQTRRPLPLTVV